MIITHNTLPETKIADGQRLLLRPVIVDRHVAGHEDLGRLPDEDGELDVLAHVLLRRVVKVLQPKVEDLLLGRDGGALVAQCFVLLCTNPNPGLNFSPFGSGSGGTRKTQQPKIVHVINHYFL